MKKQTNNLNLLKKVFPSFFTKNILKKLQNKLSDTNTQQNKDSLNVNNSNKNILIITENGEIKDFKAKKIPSNSFFIYFDENTFITMNTDTPLLNSVKSVILGVNNIMPLAECIEGCYLAEDTEYVIESCQDRNNICLDVGKEVLKGPNISTPSLIESCQNNKVVCKGSNINTPTLIESCQKTYLNIKNLYARINETHNSFQEEKIFWKRFEKTNQILVSHYKQNIEPFIPLLESNNQYILANSLKTHFNTSYYTLLSNTFNTFYSKISFICTTPFDFFKTILTLKDSLSVTPLIIKKSIKTYLKPFIINTQRLLLITIRNNTLYIRKSLKYLNNTQHILLTLNTLLDERLSINYIVEIYQSFLEKDTFILLILKTLYLLERHMYINNKSVIYNQNLSGVNNKVSELEGVNNHSNEQQGVNTNILYLQQQPLICKGILRLLKRCKYCKGKFIIEKDLNPNDLLYKKYKCKEKYCLIHLLLFSYYFEMKKVEQKNNSDVNNSGIKQEGVNNSGIKQEGANDSDSKQEGVNDSDSKQRGVIKDLDKREGVNDSDSNYNGVSKYTDIQHPFSNTTSKYKSVSIKRYRGKKEDYNDIEKRVLNRLTYIYIDNIKEIIEKRVFCNKKVCCVLSWMLKDESVNKESLKYRISILPLLSRYISYGVTEGINDSKCDSENIKGFNDSRHEFKDLKSVNDSKCDPENIKGFNDSRHESKDLKWVNNTDNNNGCNNTTLLTTLYSYTKMNNNTRRIHLFVNKIIKTFFKRNTLLEVKRVLEKVNINYDRNSQKEEVVRILQCIKGYYDLEALTVTDENKIEINFNENLLKIKPLIEIISSNFTYKSKDVASNRNVVFEGVNDQDSKLMGVSEEQNRQQGVNKDTDKQHPVKDPFYLRNRVSNSNDVQQPFSNTSTIKYPLIYNLFKKEDLKEFNDIQYTFYLLKESISTFNILSKKIEKYLSINTSYSWLDGDTTKKGDNDIDSKLEGVNNMNTKLEGVNNRSTKEGCVNDSTNEQQGVSDMVNEQQGVNKNIIKKQGVNDSTNEQYPFIINTQHTNAINNNTSHHFINTNNINLLLEKAFSILKRLVYLKWKYLINNTLIDTFIETVKILEEKFYFLDFLIKRMNLHFVRIFNTQLTKNTLSFSFNPLSYIKYFPCYYDTSIVVKSIEISFIKALFQYFNTLKYSLINNTSCLLKSVHNICMDTLVIEPPLEMCFNIYSVIFKGSLLNKIYSYYEGSKGYAEGKLEGVNYKEEEKSVGDKGSKLGGFNYKEEEKGVNNIDDKYKGASNSKYEQHLFINTLIEEIIELVIKGYLDCKENMEFLRNEVLFNYSYFIEVESQMNKILFKSKANNNNTMDTSTYKTSYNCIINTPLTNNTYINTPLTNSTSINNYNTPLSDNIFIFLKGVNDLRIILDYLGYINKRCYLYDTIINNEIPLFTFKVLNSNKGCFKDRKVFINRTVNTFSVIYNTLECILSEITYEPYNLYVLYDILEVEDFIYKIGVFKEVSSVIIKEIKGLNNKDILEGVSDKNNSYSDANNRSSKEGGVNNNSSKEGGVNNRSSKEGSVNNRSSKEGGVNNRSSKEGGVSNSIHKQQGLNNSTDEQQGLNNSIHKQQGLNNVSLEQQGLNNTSSLLIDNSHVLFLNKYNTIKTFLITISNRIKKEKKIYFDIFYNNSSNIDININTNTPTLSLSYLNTLNVNLTNSYKSIINTLFTYNYISIHNTYEFLYKLKDNLSVLQYQYLLIKRIRIFLRLEEYLLIYRNINFNTLKDVIYNLYTFIVNIKNKEESLNEYENNSLKCVCVDYMKGICRDIYKELEGVRVLSGLEGVGIKEDKLEGVTNSTYKQEGVTNSTYKQESVNDNINQQEGVNNNINEQEGVNDNINEQEGVNNNTDKQEGVSKSAYKQEGVNISINELEGLSNTLISQHTFNNSTNINPNLSKLFLNIYESLSVINIRLSTYFKIYEYLSTIINTNIGIRYFDMNMSLKCFISMFNEEVINKIITYYKVESDINGYKRDVNIYISNMVLRREFTEAKGMKDVNDKGGSMIEGVSSGEFVLGGVSDLSSSYKGVNIKSSKLEGVSDMSSNNKLTNSLINEQHCLSTYISSINKICNLKEIEEYLDDLYVKGEGLEKYILKIRNELKGFKEETLYTYNREGVGGFNQSISNQQGVNNSTFQQQGVNHSTDDQREVNKCTYQQQGVNRSTDNQRGVNIPTYILHPLNNSTNQYTVNNIPNTHKGVLIDSLLIFLKNTLNTVESYLYIIRELKGIQSTLLELYSILKNNTLETENINKIIEVYNSICVINNIKGVSNISNNTLSKNTSNTTSFNNSNINITINTLNWCNESIKILKQSMACYLKECRENSPLLCFVSDIDILRGLSDIYNIIGVIIKVYEIEGLIYDEYEIKGCYYKEESIYFITPIKLNYKGGVNNKDSKQQYISNKSNNEEGVNDLSNKQQCLNNKSTNEDGVNDLSNKQPCINNKSNNEEGFNYNDSKQEGVIKCTNEQHPLNTLHTNNLVRIINTFNYELTKMLIKMFYNRNRDLHVIDELISEYDYFKGVNCNSKREMINYKISVIDRYIKEKRGVINLYPKSYINKSISRLKGVSDTNSKLEGVSDSTTKLEGVSDSISKLEGVGDSISKLEGVSECSSKLEGVGECSSKLEGVSECSSKLEGVGDSSNKLKGVSDSISKLEGVITSYNILHLLNNNTNTSHPLNSTNTLHTLNSTNNLHPLNSSQYPLNTTDNNIMLNTPLYSFDSPYGFNYYPPPNLILTPLTITVLSYISLSLVHLQGVILYGPSGTGKTETVKYYSRLKGKRLITFCCNNTCSYDTLNNILYGCYKTQSYVCFDEFNRLTKEVMSAVEDLILYYKGVKVFLTMNLGYKGRYDLPKTLKGVLGIINVEGGLELGGDSDTVDEQQCVSDTVDEQQGVSDTVDEQKGVSDTVDEQQGVNNSIDEQKGVSDTVDEQNPFNTSNGFYEISMFYLKNKGLVISLLEFYRVLRKEIPSDLFIDLGLRGLTTILRETVERDNNPRDVSVEGVNNVNILEGVNNLSIEQQDVNSLSNEKFPFNNSNITNSLVISIVNFFVPLLRRIHIPLLINNIRYFFNKEITPPSYKSMLINSLKRRNGVILLGSTLTGKSRLIRDCSVNKVYYYNPITLSNIFGCYREGEWEDSNFIRDLRSVIGGVRDKDSKGSVSDKSNGFKGVSDKDSKGSVSDKSNNYHPLNTNHISQHPINKPSYNTWFVFDGPVTSEWIENFNSVLDDSRVLCLSSGESIRITNNCKFIFECDSISNITPATLTRVQLIRFDNDSGVLGYREIEGVENTTNHNPSCTITNHNTTNSNNSTDKQHIFTNNTYYYNPNTTYTNNSPTAYLNTTINIPYTSQFNYYFNTLYSLILTTSVIIVKGPLSTGKSTLVKSVITPFNYQYYNLRNNTDLDFYKEYRLVKGVKVYKPVNRLILCIDEFNTPVINNKVQESVREYLEYSNIGGVIIENVVIICIYNTYNCSSIQVEGVSTKDSRLKGLSSRSNSLNVSEGLNIRVNTQHPFNNSTITTTPYDTNGVINRLTSKTPSILFQHQIDFKYITDVIIERRLDKSISKEIRGVIYNIILTKGNLLTLNRFIDGLTCTSDINREVELLFRGCNYNRGDKLVEDSDMVCVYQGDNDSSSKLEGVSNSGNAQRGVNIQGTYYKGDNDSSITIYTQHPFNNTTYSLKDNILYLLEKKNVCIILIGSCLSGKTTLIRECCNIKGYTINNLDSNYSDKEVGGISNKDNEQEGISNKDNGQQGFSNSTNKQQGFIDTTYEQHPDNNTTNKQQGVSNSTNKQHPFNISTNNTSVVNLVSDKLFLKPFDIFTSVIDGKEYGRYVFTVRNLKGISDTFSSRCYILECYGNSPLYNSSSTPLYKSTTNTTIPNTTNTNTTNTTITNSTITPNPITSNSITNITITTNPIITSTYLLISNTLLLINNLLDTYNTQKNRYSFLLTGVNKILLFKEEVDTLNKLLKEKCIRLTQLKVESTNSITDLINEKETVNNTIKDILIVNKEIKNNICYSLSKRKIISKEIKGVKDSIDSVIKDIKGVDKKSVSELKSMNNPPLVIKKVLSGVVDILEGVKDRKWRDVISVVRREDFISRIVNYRGSVGGLKGDMSGLEEEEDVKDLYYEQQGVNYLYDEQQGVKDLSNEQQGVNNLSNEQQGVNNCTTSTQEGVNNLSNEQQGVNNCTTSTQEGVNNLSIEQQGVNNCTTSTQHPFNNTDITNTPSPTPNPFTLLIHKAYKASTACGPLCKWLASTLDYIEITGKLKPFIQELKCIDNSIINNKRVLSNKQECLKVKEERVIQLKEELRVKSCKVITYEREIEEIKARMCVMEECLSVMEEEVNRWKKEMEEGSVGFIEGSFSKVEGVSNNGNERGVNYSISKLEGVNYSGNEGGVNYSGNELKGGEGSISKVECVSNSTNEQHPFSNTPYLYDLLNLLNNNTYIDSSVISFIKNTYDRLRSVSRLNTNDLSILLENKRVIYIYDKEGVITQQVSGKGYYNKNKGCYTRSSNNPLSTNPLLTNTPSTNPLLTNLLDTFLVTSMENNNYLTIINTAMLHNIDIVITGCYYYCPYIYSLIKHQMTVKGFNVVLIGREKEGCYEGIYNIVYEEGVSDCIREVMKELYREKGVNSSIGLEGVTYESSKLEGVSNNSNSTIGLKGVTYLSSKLEGFNNNSNSNIGLKGVTIENSKLEGVNNNSNTTQHIFSNNTNKTLSNNIPSNEIPSNNTPSNEIPSNTNNEFYLLNSVISLENNLLSLISNNNMEIKGVKSIIESKRVLDIERKEYKDLKDKNKEIRDIENNICYLYEDIRRCYYSKYKVYLSNIVFKGVLRNILKGYVSNKVEGVNNKSSILEGVSNKDLLEGVNNKVEGVKYNPIKQHPCNNLSITSNPLTNNIANTLLNFYSYSYMPVDRQRVINYEELRNEILNVEFPFNYLLINFDVTLLKLKCVSVSCGSEENNKRVLDTLNRESICIVKNVQFMPELKDGGVRIGGCVSNRSTKQHPFNNLNDYNTNNGSNYNTNSSNYSPVNNLNDYSPSNGSNYNTNSSTNYSPVNNLNDYSPSNGSNYNTNSSTNYSPVNNLNDYNPVSNNAFKRVIYCMEGNTQHCLMEDCRIVYGEQEYSYNNIYNTYKGIIRDIRLEGVSNKGTRLESVSNKGTRLKGVNNKGSRLKGVNNKGSRLKGVNNKGTRLKGVNNKGSILKSVSNKGSRLEGINNKGSRLKSVSNKTINIRGVNSRPINTYTLYNILKHSFIYSLELRCVILHSYICYISCYIPYTLRVNYEWSLKDLLLFIGCCKYMTFKESIGVVYGSRLSIKEVSYIERVGDIIIGLKGCVMFKDSEMGVNYKDNKGDVNHKDSERGFNYKDSEKGINHKDSEMGVNYKDSDKGVNYNSSKIHPLNDGTSEQHPFNTTNNTNTLSYTWLFSYYDILKDKSKGKEYEIINNKELIINDYKGVNNTDSSYNNIDKSTPLSIKVRLYKALIVEGGVNYSMYDNVCYLCVKAVKSSDKKRWVWVVNKGVVDKVYVDRINGCYYTVIGIIE